MKQNLDTFFSFLKPAEPILKEFSNLVLKWQKSVNLISPSTIGQIWERHILDSAQLYPYIPSGAKILVDIGSGAGFPGIIIAILNKYLNGNLEKIILVESDKKKCIFLMESVRILDLQVEIINDRVEKIDNISCDVLTARALADVATLLKWSEKIVSRETICLFLKGVSVKSELTGLSDQFDVQLFPSKIDPSGFILKIGSK